MAGAYAKEFEKWLQGSKQNEAPTEDDSGDLDDSGDEVDNCQSVKEQEGGQAPVLFKNHGNSKQSSGKNTYFQDEPPILKPVIYSSHRQVSGTTTSHKNSDILDEVFSESYEQTDSVMREVEASKIKTRMFLESGKYSCNKGKESENIFDKFSMLAEDDFPPPLIPSHEAHLTTVDAKDEDSLTEKSYATLQNLSPNFCAMEADSTSEMQKADRYNAKITFKERSKKTMLNNDIGVECDSTCMLGASPYVVSPGSVSTLESDNPLHTPNQEFSNFSDDNTTVSWNIIPSRERFDLLPHEHVEKQFLGRDYEGNLIRNKGTGVLENQEFGWDREYPKLEPMMDVSESKDTYYRKRTEDIEDPPQLSIIPPTLKTPNISVRRKRHTIDSVQSIKKPRHQSQSHSKDSSIRKFKEIDHIACETNSYTDSTVCDESSSNNSESHRLPSSKRKDSLSHTHSRHHSMPRKHRRKRCQTLPIVDLISYGSHLPRHLHRFVVDSSQLSNLQGRMHHLLSLLFPQLSSELSVMSPESSGFEKLLKDLFQSLKEHEGEPTKTDVVPAVHPRECFELKNAKKDIVEHCSVADVSHSIEFHCVASDAPSSSDRNSTCRPVERDNTSYDNGSNGNIPCNSNDMDSVDQHSLFQSSETANEHTFSNSVIPRLSELSLTKEEERVLKRQPSVLIHKDPSAVHKNFIKLSCSVLQLLLPELTVSLSKEFADSSDDLIFFIDSVIAFN